MRRQPTLRVSHVLTIVIGFIVLALGWHNHRKLSRLREIQFSLVEKAQNMGLNPGNPVPLSTRTIRDDHKNIDQIAREFIACTVEFKDCNDSRDFQKLDQASRDRIISATDTVILFNQGQLQHLVEIISDEAGLDAKVRKKLLIFALGRWSQFSNRAVFDYLSKSPDLMEQLDSSLYLLFRNTVPAWIERAPDEVIGWLRETREILPGKIQDSAIHKYAEFIAKDRPLETFDLFSEFHDDPHRFFPSILRKANKLTVADRAAALTRIREMAQGLNDPAAREEYLAKNLQALVIGQESNQGDFQTAIDTIAATNLQIEDLDFIWNPFKDDLIYHHKVEQTGEWIAWLEENVPVEKYEFHRKRLLEHWQSRDPEAATAFVREHAQKD